MRLSILLSVALLAPLASAQPQYPVIFVHGLGSSNWTWAEAADAFESEGWGPALVFHYDLNVNGSSTRYLDDVRGHVEPLSFWALADPSPLDDADSTALTRGVVVPGVLQNGQDLTEPESATNAVGASNLFFVNFENWYDSGANQMHYYGHRGDWGQSDSDCSAIVKQAWAVSRTVNRVLEITGAERVILVGHSMGGLAIREYLQRTGAPSYRTPHGVAAVVTYGTPHLGARGSEWAAAVCFSSGADEAIRDMDVDGYSPPENRMLYGGDESTMWGWHNTDIDADGSENDWITGLNVAQVRSVGTRAHDNPAAPLPTNVAYTYVTSTNDGYIQEGAQHLSYWATDGSIHAAPYGMARVRTTAVSHTSQTDDVATLRSTILSATWTAEEDEPAAETEALTVVPNPTAGPATATVTLGADGRARVLVVDALGRTVAEHEAVGPAGARVSVPLGAGAWPAGVYVVRVEAGRTVSAARLTVVR